MRFKLARQEISQELKAFGLERIKRDKFPVVRALKNILLGISAVTREIDEYGMPRHLVLRKLRKGLGHGIFLHPKAQPILKGEVIGPYSGEVSLAQQNGDHDSDYIFTLIPGLILTKEEQSHYDPKSPYHPRRYYSIELDAEKKGNFTRFINHSSEPNIEAELFRIPANSLDVEPAPFEMIYLAKKTIRPGEQLLICYEGEDKTYWGASKIKPFPMTPKTFQLDSSLNVYQS